MTLFSKDALHSLQAAVTGHRHIQGAPADPLVMRVQESDHRFTVLQLGPSSSGNLRLPRQDVTRRRRSSHTLYAPLELPILGRRWTALAHVRTTI
jgi:hypothetical protein